VFVKICGITNPDDALLAAGLGAHAVGLNFADSPRRITTDSAEEILRRLPREVLAVGVFRNQDREQVMRTVNTLGLRAVQLHGSETPEDTRWVGARVHRLIRAFSVADPALVSGDDYGPHWLLIDSPAPGSGQVFDWSNLEQVAGGRHFILAGGLGPDNVADAIRVARPWGVDVASGVESAPGRKDPARLRRFITTTRDTAAELGLDHDPFDLADSILFGPEPLNPDPDPPALFDPDEPDPSPVGPSLQPGAGRSASLEAATDDRFSLEDDQW
jgi:phosphoribosylanthranilate isomerase